MTPRVIHPLLALFFAPLMVAVINRIKAKFAGRVGPPLLQPYYDLWKLLFRESIRNRTTTYFFRLGALVAPACAYGAILLLPLGGLPSAVSFPGDFLLLTGLFAFGRITTILAALDTGSSFEGMGASREGAFSALAEPTLLIALAALARVTQSLSLSEMQASIDLSLWGRDGATLALVVLALVIIMLIENARIPFDDPTTHLELTMIHEVMILDHSGADLAFIEYGAALKLWGWAALLISLIPIRISTHLNSISAWTIAFETAIGLGLIFGVAILIGTVESTLARFRLSRMPQFLAGAGAVAMLALLLAIVHV